MSRVVQMIYETEAEAARSLSQGGGKALSNKLKCNKN